jgi:galactosylceramidase
MLFAAVLLLLPPPPAAATYAISDEHGVGRVFEGVGAISGGGATSRLLVDYSDPYRAQILDYLFLPNFGASLQILKVEIGGSCDSTNGAEAPHRYTAEEAPSFARGYEWWLLREALARNPAIRVYGLPWCFPAYIGNGTQNPFGPGTSGGAAAAAYVTEWAVAARDLYNATPWALGLFNEKPSTPDYILSLRSALDAAGLAGTHLVASDEGGWPGAAQVLGNASVAAAVGLLGSHYPGSSSSSQALATGLPLLASEDNSRSSLPGANGGACWARVLNENQAHGNLTGSISWSLINSWYEGIEFYGDGLASAVQPWSGSYYIGAPIWATAHTSHHAFPGWRYLQRGAGVGYLAGGGTYATLLSPSATDATIVIEKLDRAASQCSWSSSPKNATSPETATFTLGGTLARITSLHVYRSTFDATGSADPAAMYASQGTLAVVGGTFSISVAVNDVITLSTVQGTKGAHAPPPAPAPFPTPYAPNLTDVPLAQEPKYLSDVSALAAPCPEGAKTTPSPHVFSPFLFFCTLSTPPETLPPPPTPNPADERQL